MSETAGNGYTVKEMLDRLVIPKLESIDGKLDSKADVSVVMALQREVAALSAYIPLRDTLIKEFHEAVADIEALKAWRNRLVGASGILAGFAAAAGYTIHHFLG